MAKMFEFHIPSDFRRVSRASLPGESGKVVAFPTLVDTPANTDAPESGMSDRLLFLALLADPISASPDGSGRRVESITGGTR
jgi:hypothetical protein